MSNGELRSQLTEQPLSEEPRLLEDATLIRRFANGRDEEAFAELVLRYRLLVYGVCQRVLHHRQDVEDAFQAAFLILARDAADIRHRQSIAGWLYSVAYRVALKARAERSRRRELPLREVPPEESRMEHPDSLLTIARRSELETLDEELHALPDKYREPLVLHYLMGQTCRDIARELSLSVSAVEGRLKRGRERLRKRLLRRGIGLTAALGALALSQSEIQAVVTPTLIENTVRAGLTFGSADSSSFSNSQEVARLAAREVGSMTATAAGTTGVVVLAAALVAGIVGALAGPSLGGNVENETVSPRLIAAGGARGPSVRTDGSEIPVRFVKSGEVKSRRVPSPVARRTAKEERPAAVAPANGARVAVLPEETPARQKIEQALEGTAGVALIDVPLKDAMDTLAERHKITILFDRKALDEEGVSTDEPVNLSVKERISLHSALNQMLEPLGLDYLIRNEVLLITTKTVADEFMETRIYDVRNLRAFPPDELVEVIRNTTAPYPDGYWLAVEGTKKTVQRARPSGGFGPQPPQPVDRSKNPLPGEIPGMGVITASPRGVLVVTHNQRMHRRIRQLLDNLARFSGK